MIYIGFFFASILLLKLAFILKKSNVLYKLCIAVSIIIPCLVAALRADSVGTDTKDYVSIFMSADSALSFGRYFTMINHSWKISDLMFLFVSYTVLKLTNSIEVELFVQEALVIVPVFSALFIISKNKNQVILGAEIFYLFWYSMSLNMVRQSIALSFEVLALAFLEKSNKKLFLIFSLIGILFHSTSICIYGIYLLYWFIKTKSIKQREKYLIEGFMIIIAIVFVANFRSVMTLIHSLNWVGSRYYGYIFTYLKSAADVEWSSTFLYIAIFALMVLNKKMLSENFRYLHFYLMMLALGSIVFQLSIMIEFAQRIAFYFLWPCIFIILPQFAVKNSSCIKRKELICHILILAIFLSDFVWKILVHNGHRTLPYLLR